jgi:hypothetical protein
MEEREIEVLGIKIPEKFAGLALEVKKEVVSKIVNERLDALNWSWDYVGNGSLDRLDLTFKGLNFLAKKSVYLAPIDFPARGRGIVKKIFQHLKFWVYRIFIRPFIWPFLDVDVNFKRQFLKVAYHFMARRK